VQPIPKDRRLRVKFAKGRRERAKFTKGRHGRAITAEQTRITAREDHWLPARIAVCQDRCMRGSLRGQQSLRQVSVCERTQSVSASPRVVTLGRVWEKNVGPYVAVLCEK